MILSVNTQRYDRVLAEHLGKAPCNKLHVHAPAAEHKAQQILENPECRDAFLFLAPAGSEQCSNSVIGVKTLQCCADFPLFKFLILCYACHGKDVVHRADENMYKNKKKK